MMKTIFRARGLLLRIVQSGVFLLALLSFTRADNLQDLISQSRSMIGDSPYYTSIPKLTDSQIINYLNEGQDFIAAQTLIFVRRTTFTLVAGTTEYSLPPNFQTSQRVTLDDKALPESTLEALDGTLDNSAWIRTSGTPKTYYIRTTTVTVIGFYPVATVTSTGSIALDYYTHVQPMKELTDVPFNGTQQLYFLHKVLPKFVAYRYSLLSGNKDMAQIYASDFAADLKRIEVLPALKPNYRPGFSVER